MRAVARKTVQDRTQTSKRQEVLRHETLLTNRIGCRWVAQTKSSEHGSPDCLPSHPILFKACYVLLRLDRPPRYATSSMSIGA